MKLVAQYPKNTEVTSFMEKEYNDLVAVVNRLQRAVAPSPFPISTMLWSSAPDLETWEKFAGSGWTLADGRSVPDSIYARVMNKTSVPDMRGRYPRMRSYGSGINPDGDLAVGEIQSDEFLAHNGHVTGGNGIAAGAGIGNISRGGNETRPKTMILNCFIKIN